MDTTNEGLKISEDVLDALLLKNNKKHRKAKVAEDKAYLNEEVMFQPPDVPSVQQAKAELRTAVKNGEITKGRCHCGSGNVYALIKDTHSPLDVEWLCPSHYFEKTRSDNFMGQGAPKKRKDKPSRKRMKAQYDASVTGKLRKKASAEVRKAIAAGELKKKLCEKCNATDVWAEYKCSDYHNPTIGIRWFCPHCYLARRKKETESNQ